MKKILLFMFALCAMSATAQNVFRFHENAGRKCEPSYNAYAHPLVCDLHILPNPEAGKNSENLNENDALRWSFTMPKEDVEISFKGNTENIRKYAIYKTINKYKADCLVASLVNIDTEDADREGYKISVTGYLANFINWRNAGAADFEWIRMEQSHNDNKYYEGLLQDVRELKNAYRIAGGPILKR